MKNFKIRDKTTGLFFQPSKRGHWKDKGKIYNTLGHARSSVRQIIEKYKLSRNNIEIVEFEFIEKKIY